MKIEIQLSFVIAIVKMTCRGEIELFSERILLFLQSNAPVLSTYHKPLFTASNISPNISPDISLTNFPDSPQIFLQSNALVL